MGTYMTDEEITAAPEPELTEAQAAVSPETVQPAAEAQPETDKGAETRKRIAKLTWEREQAKREAEALRAIIAQGKGQPAQPSIDDQVTARAAEIAAAQKFNDDCDATYAKGIKDFPDFAEAVSAFKGIGGLAIRTDFLDAVNALDNGHAVLRHLGQNLDEATDLFGMKPARMAIELAKISGILAKPPTRAVSKAPSPPEPTSGKVAASKSVDNMSMQEMMDRDKARRQARR